MGAAVIALLERMRRAQQRRRPDGMRISLPAHQVTEIERGLRIAADRSLLSDIELGIRLIRHVVVPGEARCPTVLAVRCDGSSLAFLLDSDSRGSLVPLPFRPSQDGEAWIIETAWLHEEGTAVLGGGRDEAFVLPTLVTLGADDEKTLLVDIEAMRSLALQGRDAKMILQGMTVELSTVPWGETADIVVVGGDSNLASLERARRLPSVAALVAEVRRRVADPYPVSRSTTARYSDMRWIDDESCWDPVVAVCFPEAADAEPEAIQQLLALVEDGGAGVATVVGASCPRARWHVIADGGPLDLRGPGHFEADVPPTSASDLIGEGTLRPQPVPPDLLERVDELLESAAELSFDVDSEADSVGETPIVGPCGQSPSRAHEVEVRFLGPVDVVGAARPFSRVWALDLVVYLATRRAGASNDEWQAALWPDRVLAAPSLHSTASAARRSLGTATDGTDHLPRAHGRLELGQGVTSDWARFQALSRSDDPKDWEEALNLVRGRPFHGLRSPDWPVLEGITATIESSVVDVASRYAEHVLSEGTSAAKAEHGARQALLVSPYDERMYRILLRTADALGNPEGVEAAMRELVTLVADDIEPYDAVHPETWELYSSLSRRSRFRRGA